MRRAHFGWRQVAAVGAALGIALPVLTLAGDSASGRWQLPSTDWPSDVSWMSDVSAPGGFRVLWVGDPALLPADGKVLSGKGLSGIAFTLTGDGPGDARALWAASEHRADKILASALVATFG